MRSTSRSRRTATRNLRVDPAAGGSLKLRLATLLAAALLLASACTTGGSDDPPSAGPAAPGATPVPGGVVSFGVVGEPATYDPYSPRASDLTYALVRPLFPSLFRFLPDGSTEPLLAESLEPQGDGVLIRLRALTWSSGRPVVARDVLRSIARARPPSGFAAIEDARPRGPRALLVEGTVDDWERTLATFAYVLPNGRVSGVPRDSAGPFAVRRHTPGLGLVFEHNPRWTGDPPLLDRVRVRFTQSLDVLLALLRRGRLDAAALPMSVNLDDRLELLGLDHQESLGWETVYLDLEGAGLSRRQRVRLWRAVDRDAIASGFIRDDGRLANTLYPAPGPEGADGPFSDSLGPAGPPPEFPVRIAASNSDELARLVQRALFRQLQTSGFEVELLGIEPRVFEGRWRVSGPADVAIRRRAGAPGLADGSRAARTLDALPLFHVESVVAHTGRLRELRPNPTFEGPLWNIERWWRVPDL